MKRRLYLKLLLSYALYGAIALLILCTFTQHMIREYLIAQETQNLYRKSTLIATEYATSYYDDSITLHELQKQLGTLSTYLSTDIWLVDPQGNILLDAADSDVAYHALQQEYETIPDFDISDFGNSYSKIGTFYDCYSTDTLTVFSPITVGYTVRGYILIHKPLDSITSSATELLNICFYTVGILFLCSFVILIIFSFVVYFPLRKIAVAADAYAKGKFDEKIKIHSNDEIGHLSNRLNYMASELQTFEEDQRKFVSNVSHDFRSPLTSIKGYVEAMLDGTIPVEMQEKYLNIILFETERLNKLTHNLLDLNRLGHHGLRLEYTDFDINHMIRTTLLTFEGICNKKNITFDLILTGKELFIRADMIKIQQVLYNLIDNAIKFSNSDSTIKVETSIKNEKVLISIKDNGIGIPQESLKKIWDRFYKTDSSRGKDKQGTGLGLAITKEIIQAHEENISVVSTEGAGTEFLFTMPLSKKEIS